MAVQEHMKLIQDNEATSTRRRVRMLKCTEVKTGLVSWRVEGHDDWDRFYCFIFDTEEQARTVYAALDV